MPRKITGTNRKGQSFTPVKSLTRTEYLALPQNERNRDDIVYLITE